MNRERGVNEALLEAIRHSHVADVRWCLDHGADVNRAARYGETPLHLACRTGHIDVVAAALLLLDRVDEHRRSPFLVACRENRIGTATLLLDRGAFVDRANVNRRTPLTVACRGGHAKVALLCVQRGADVHWRDRNGWTPLHFACSRGHLDPARVCIEHGADTDWADTFGSSPYDYARRNGHAALAAWLARISAAGGWTRHLSEPRYELVVLRSLCARGRAQRADSGKEQLLDFLFPSDQSPLDQPHLPDELFSIIARYYWGGELTAEDEAAAAEEASAASSDSE